MEEIEFIKYFARPKISDYVGSYLIVDEEGQLVAKSEGISVKRRYITFVSKLNNYQCEIWPSTRYKYNFGVGADIHSILFNRKKVGFSKLELITNTSTILELVTKDAKTYMIGIGRVHIGVISCEDWRESDVMIRLINHDYVNEIFCAVIAIGHYSYSNFIL